MNELCDIPYARELSRSNVDPQCSLRALVEPCTGHRKRRSGVSWIGLYVFPVYED